MQETTAQGASSKPKTSVEVRCTGHVRSAVGHGVLEFGFGGDTHQEFLEAFFAEYDFKDMILAGPASAGAAHGWASVPDELPGVWRKNPPGDRTRRFARVTVNGVFNEHLEGLDTRIGDGDRVALMYPFVFSV